VNALTSLPARVRQGLYVAYGLLVIAYGALTAAYLTDPAWLDVAGRVLTTLAVPFAALAATHVTTPALTTLENAEPVVGTSLAEREAAENEAAENEAVDGWVADAPEADPNGETYSEVIARQNAARRAAAMRLDAPEGERA
jgi:hypothetical protein